MLNCRRSTWLPSSASPTRSRQNCCVSTCSISPSTTRTTTSEIGQGFFGNLYCLERSVSLVGCTCLAVCCTSCLSVSLSLCLSVCLSACLSVCLSVCLPCLTVSYCRAGSDLHVHSFMRLSMTTNLLPYRVLLCPSMPKRYCLLPNQLQSLSLPSKVGGCLSR